MSAAWVARLRISEALERLERTDDAIRAMRALWNDDRSTYEGESVSFRNVVSRPKPAQPGGIPIHVGGHSKAALRRAARYGDGWHPVGANAAVPLTAQELSKSIEELKRLTEAEGRDFDALDLSYKAGLYDTGLAQPDGARRAFSGTDAEVIDDIHTYEAIGISELVFDIRSNSLTESLERMDHFATDIMAHAGN